MISVIICTYNRCETLKLTLASLAEMSVPGELRWELIVVDNNSRDATADVIRTFAGESGLNVRYVFETAQGLTHARNRAIAEASGDILIFTDDDVTVDKSWLAEMAHVFHDPSCAAAGGKIVALWERPKPAWLRESGPYALHKVVISFDCGEQICKAPEPPFGANMAFRKELFTKYGVFRTDLGRTGNVLLSGEETELFRRVLSGNEKVFYTPHAVVYHPVEAHRLKKSYFQRWYYQYGRGCVRQDGAQMWHVTYFGMPRYLLRQLIAHAFRWTFALRSDRRFYEKAQIYRIAGMIAECRSWHASQSKQIASPEATGAASSGARTS